MAKPIVKSSSSQNKSAGTATKIIRLLAVVVLLAGVGVLVWQYLEVKKDNKELTQTVQNQQTQIEEYKTNPEAAAQAEVNRILEDVGKVYDLPPDETPSVATVQDKEKLKDQPFFEKAENGDVTLIYQKAKQAILYRPSTNKVINVSSVVLEDQQRN